MSPRRHKVPPLPIGCYKSILDYTFDGVNYVDGKRRILYWNKGAETMTGYRAEEVLGHACYRDSGMCHINDEGERLCGRLCPLLDAISTKRERVNRVYLRHKDGRRIPVDAVSSPVYDEDGEAIGVVQVFRDATVYEEAERKSQVIAKLATTDALTGLLNRRTIDIELEIEFKRATRLKLPMAVIFCDIDHFKDINDKHGHAIGDEVLKGMAKLLQGGIREYDRAGRYGGEEFLVMLPETKVEIAVEIAERLRRSVDVWRLIHREKHWPFQVTMSFGVSEMRQDATWEDLVKRADQAMYKAKRSGRNAVFVS
ncbi:MAG: sensor domain-containing diguanylate cyclase [Candidatus Edwardsbacteria bacterium]|jgi:diguanylate cyclase (GGDEF)-like protein/PAS domain S-box-containing protein|nr:sensor domain-containing diguanylate cyclase [Candidatus Edwardsbacteria bacterium]